MSASIKDMAENQARGLRVGREMRGRIERLWLYIVFFAPLAIFYEPVKEYLGGGVLFVLCSVIYLCICSVLAVFLGKPSGRE